MKIKPPQTPLREQDSDVMVPKWIDDTEDDEFLFDIDEDDIESQGDQAQ